MNKQITCPRTPSRSLESRAGSRAHRTWTAFWRNLREGRESITFFARDELDPTIPAEISSRPNYVRAKGKLDDVDKFDAPFFDIPPLEADLMDPQQRLLLELSWAALEDAGIVPGEGDNLIGVWVGTNWNRYYARHVRGSAAEQRYGEFNAQLANEYDFPASRIAYKLNLTGPAVTLATACSTSLVAIGQAVQSLLNFECNAALAGGASVSVPLHAGYLYKEGEMLSRDGHCRPFDANSSGTTFNDGAAVVTLKRLEDAVADGDDIYAVIRGVGINNDGSDKVSYTAPSVNGQIDVLSAALAVADVDPATIGLYRDARNGDPARGPDRGRGDARSLRHRPCRAALRTRLPEEQYRPHHSRRGYRRRHQGGAGGARWRHSADHQFRIAQPGTATRRQPVFRQQGACPVAGAAPRRAGVSSFGVGGTNAHAVIEQPPAVDPEVASRARKQCAAVVAGFCQGRRSLHAADHESRRLRPDSSGLDESCRHRIHPGAGPDPVRFQSRRLCARPCGTGRGRRAIPTDHSRQGAIPEQAGVGIPRPGRPETRHGRRTGSRITNLSRRLARCHGANSTSTLTSISMTCLRITAPRTTGSRKPSYAQPALFAVGYALAEHYTACGLKPDALIGHSIGEFAAACIAGVFSLEDTARLVCARGRLMQAQPRGAMLSVSAPPEQLEPVY